MSFSDDDRKKAEADNARVYRLLADLLREGRLTVHKEMKLFAEFVEANKAADPGPADFGHLLAVSQAMVMAFPLAEYVRKAADVGGKMRAGPNN